MSRIRCLLHIPNLTVQALLTALGDKKCEHEGVEGSDYKLDEEVEVPHYFLIQCVCFVATKV